MIYIPFIYFSLLLFFIYKKRGFDASAYITLLYVITSFASILMASKQLIEPVKNSPSFVSTLVYCVLLGLLILPVYLFDSKKIKKIIITHNKAVDWLVYLNFISFLFTIVIYWPDILFKLTYGDWDELRTIVMRGDGISKVHITGLLKMVSNILSIIGSASFLMFPIFFISLIYYKKPWWYSLMAILSTTNVIWLGIMAIDRSATFRWLLFLGLNLVIFWPLLTSKVRRVILPLLSVLVLGALAYIMSVSMSRFEDTSDGTKGSLISYAGQPYFNFCYFFENFNNHEGITTKYLLPATHCWILGDYESTVHRQQELTLKTGMECGVFYTVLGTFILDANQIGPFIFIILYLIIFLQCLKGKNRGGIITLWSFIKIYLVLLIPTFGIIAYLYVNQYTNLFIVILFLAHYLYAVKY